MPSSKPLLIFSKLDPILFPVWIVVCFLALTYKLGEVPPYHTDESYYTESVKTMVETGDYVTPYYHGKKRFAKPILVYWLMAAAYKAFGFSPAVSRLVSAMMGTLYVVLVWLLARQLFDRTVAWWSALILPGFYLHFLVSRWATTDMTMNLFILAAYYFFARGYKKETGRAGNFYLFYLCMALGFLSKGPPAVFIPGITVVCFLAVTRQWKLFSQLRLLAGGLIFLGVNSPWYTAMFLLHGEEYMNYLAWEFRYHTMHDTPFSLYYMGVLFLRYYLVWSLFFISALLVYTGLVFFPASGSKGSPSLQENVKARIRNLLQKDSWPLLFCFVGVLVPLLIFTLLRSEHSRYVLPVSPFIAMLLGCFFRELAKSPGRFRSPLFKIPLVLTLLIYGAMAIGLGVAVIVFRSLGPVPFAIKFLVFFLVLGVIALILLYAYKKEAQGILAMAIIQITTLAIISGDAVPFFNHYPMKKFAAVILESGNGSEPVAVYRLGRNRPRLGVLTGHVVLGIDKPEELRRFIMADEKVFVVMRAADRQEEFGNDPLVLSAVDSVWKKQTFDEEKLMTVWNDGLKSSLPNYFEPLALLTNR